MYQNTLEIIARLLTLTLALTALLGCASERATSVATEQAEAEATPRSIEVFFVTDRAPDEDRYFGPERGEVSYGIATVAIPPGHELGRHEEPSLLKFEWSPDEHKHIALRDVAVRDEQGFYQQLGRAIAGAPEGKVMVFVPGYNAGFAETARVFAQFANDLKFPGPVLLFSWPSQESVTGYSVDETNVEWAQAHFVQALHHLLDRTSAQRIYLIGHSMGNRPLSRGFTVFAADRPVQDLQFFRSMVMIAPDVDADVFRQDLAPRLARTGVHVTLYASVNDRALRASKIFHGYPRAGEAGEGLVVVDGVETVDASETSGGLLGHSYFAEDRRIMEDIYSLLQTGQRAEQRFGLEAVDSAKGRYWTFRR
jgi:esterase/lipase superfamily enzyme